MSDEQTGDRWGDPIIQERQAELKALADKQREWVAQPKATRGDSVFVHVELTGADVSWLAEESKRGLTGTAPNLHLEGADLRWAHLEGASLSEAHLEGANLLWAQLAEATLREAHLEETNLWEAHLEGTVLSDAHLEGANLFEAHLQGADLRQAHLEGTNLFGAHLEGADLRWAHLEGANLRETHLEGAELNAAKLERTDLDGATLDKTSHLNEAVLTGVSLDQVTFDNVNLTVVDWSLVPILGDELTARTPKDKNGKRKDAATRRVEYAAAVRANRVLAVTLRSQGLNEDADRYAYRAQVLQRQVLWRQRKPLQALFSLFLDALAGHGYRPQRSLIAYLLAIFSFGIAYYIIGQVVGPHLSPLGAFVFSMTSFHGRGFFPGGIALDDPITVLAAFEAFTGLVIEVSFIATFTQRFFAR